MTSGGKKFLDPKVLLEATTQIGHLAKKEGLHIALLGGFALQFYGSERLTGDIDIVSSGRLQSLPRVKSLSFGGDQATAPNGVPVDVILRDDDYEKLYDEALEKSVRVKGAPIPLVRPEYIAAMKMIANRTRDNADLEFLILSGVADVAKTKRIIKKYLGFYGADSFDRIVDEVAWKASKGRI